MTTYEISISGSQHEEGINADIKYPCGEVVDSWRCDTLQEATDWVNQWTKDNPFKKHKDCRDEYCEVYE